MPDVFVSHSSADAGIAGQVVSALEDDGLSCWIAPRDIGPGTWGDAIIRGIEACRAMVLLFSSSANNSAHVLREVERAVGKELTIIPFRIDDAGPNRDMEYFLSATQWLDARRPPLPERIGELVRHTRSALGAGDRSERAGVRAPSQPRTASEPLKWAQLHADGINGSLLAHDQDGHFLYWANPDQAPTAGKIDPMTEVVLVQGNRALTQNVLAWNTGGRASGTVACWRLSAHPEILWSHAFESARSINMSRPLTSQQWIAVLTGRPHATLRRVDSVVKVVDCQDGKLRSSIVLDAYPFGIWEKEATLLSWEPTSYTLTEHNGENVRVVQDRSLLLRDIDGSVVARRELLPKPGDRPSSLAQGRFIFYRAPGKLVLHDLSDPSASQVFERPEGSGQEGGDGLLSADGNFLLVWNWPTIDCFTLECYEIPTRRLVASLSLKTELPQQRRMYGWAPWRNYAWEPEARLFLLLGKPTGSSEADSILHLWQMPAGELVGMRRWSGNRPISAVFGPKSTCYVGTDAGEVFSLRLPDLRVDRQLA